MSNLLTKYKPKTLDELPLPDNTIRTLKNILEFKGGVYIFHSPPGTGKSTACDIIRKEAIKKLGSANILLINGSMENTVDVIVNKIQPFVSKAPRRLVIIEEADKMTKETGKGKGAQEALKDLTTRTIHKVTWIFVTNHLEDIILPLRDRAIIIEFKPDEFKILEILKRINAKEHLGYSIEKLKSIVKTTYPSIRNAILKLEGVEIRQFDEAQLMKDLKRLVEDSIHPKVFCEKYKSVNIRTIIHYLTDIGYQYFDPDIYTRLLLISSFISDIKDEQLAYVTFAYLVNQMNKEHWQLIIDEICATTISIKSISARFYQKLQEFNSKKNKVKKPKGD